MNSVYIFLKSFFIKTAEPSLIRLKASNDEEAFKETNGLNGMILKKTSYEFCEENFNKKVFFFLLTYPKGISVKTIWPEQIQTGRDLSKKRYKNGEFYVLLL